MLLDEAFARTSTFINLIKKANVEHILNLGYSRQIEDKNIYNRAIKEDRFIVTVNFKDFKKLVRIGKPGIIGLPSELSNSDVDFVLTNFVSKNNPLECLGKAIKITEEEVARIKTRR